MKVAFKSDVGKKRENNEDNIMVDEVDGIFLLADGMGGHNAGEIASRIAVEQAHKCIEEGISRVSDEKDISKLLIDSVFRAHDGIKEIAKEKTKASGMGTTLTILLVKEMRAYICHVGDSRVYLLRDRLKILTRDHTVGDYLVENMNIKREDIPPSKWHALTQSVGVSENIVPELNQVDLLKNDSLLVCSDGLSNMLNDEEIYKIIRKYRGNVKKAVELLVKNANEKGGKDNISVIFIDPELSHMSSNTLPASRS